MRRKNKLNFSSERQTKAKRTRAFVLSFVAFILVFGSVSLLVFMKSLDFDLQNLVKKPDSPSASAETTAAETMPIKLSDTNVLLVCSGGNKQLSLLALVSAHAESESITVSAIDPMHILHTETAVDQNFQSVLYYLRLKIVDDNEKTILKMQPIRSYESTILQLTDVMIGAITYYYRDLNTNQSKLKIINTILQKSVYGLKQNTPYKKDKFNIFIWDPTK